MRIETVQPNGADSWVVGVVGVQSERFRRVTLSQAELAFTAEVAAKLGKPCLVADLGLYAAADLVAEFMEAQRVRTLNVAGPRESRSQGIQERARQVLLGVFRRAVAAPGITFGVRTLP